MGWGFRRSGLKGEIDEHESIKMSFGGNGCRNSLECNVRAESPLSALLSFLTILPVERDLRRNAGYSTITIRLHDRRIPYAWLTRLGYTSIPVFLAGLILKNWGDCFRCSLQYGVRWFEIPVALFLAVVVNGMEIPGMVDAFRRREISKTAYR